MPVRAIHQIMPAFLYGDAVGNQAFRIRELLRQWGFKSQIYAQIRDPRLSDPGIDYTRYRGSRDNVLIFHYPIGSPVTGFVRQLPDRVVLYYHNITPPEFLRQYNLEMAAMLELGYRELASFKDTPFALAASEYNRQEMLSVGFNHVEVMPYFLYFDELLASAESRPGRDVAELYADGWVNLLFVGRVVPNKRQDNLIQTFNYYHRLVQPRSRLILVGSETSAPGYRLELEAMQRMLELEHVHLLGPVGLCEGLGGYYRAASVFVCLSEHEGFCVPLVEAMRFDVPVIAYNATGVPYALGGAGVLVSRKRYDIIGELIDIVVNDASVRQRIIERQRARLAELSPDLVAARLQQIVKHLTAGQM